MKQVMSREDSDILLKHGFKTAAFGAVSFNHHTKESITPTSAAIMKKLGKIKDEREQLGQLLIELSSSPSPADLSDAFKQVHSSSNVIPDSSEDSIENVPIWLRTYVADTLRYIEYERRALPVSLVLSTNQCSIFFFAYTAIIFCHRSLCFAIKWSVLSNKRHS
jgi:hypothetical protein